MKYLCLVYLDDAHWSACPDQECFDFAKELAASGRLVAAEPLHAGGASLNSSPAKRVHIGNGQRHRGHRRSERRPPASLC